MSISLTEDFKTTEELRDDPNAILEQVQRTGRPAVITVQGKPAVVILTAAEYEHLAHTLNLARLLGQAEESVRAGKVRPAEEFFKELLSEKGRAKKVAR